LKRVPAYLQRSATKEQRAELKARGHRVTDKGVIIDSPRDAERKQISGAKFQIQKGGIIKWSVRQRRDYIVGFTKKEKKDFAKDPQSVIARTLAKLRKENPSFKGLKRKPQVRLQWGAYQAQKDFSIRQFFASDTGWRISQAEKKPTKKNREAYDILVGLHIVIHVPKARKK
jgi:hypothetical protein